MRLALRVVATTMFVTACGGGHVALPDLARAYVGDTAQLVVRGKYIVRNIAVCGGCHAADPQNADGPLSGGLAFRNWRIGTVRAANLTPDVETGIGRWSDAEIVRAIRNGEDKDGHLLVPVMPYEWLHEMSDDDALAVARYLKSQPAVRNEIKSSHSIAFKFAKIFMLKVKAGGGGRAPERAPTPAYGQYLANHVGLCAECHTPRGGLQDKPRMHMLFAGSAKPPKDFPANPANLTPDNETGIGEWSEEDFIHTLLTGTDPDGDKLDSFMPYKYVNRMTDDDLRAIYRYLHTLNPIHNEVAHRHHH